MRRYLLIAGILLAPLLAYANDVSPCAALPNPEDFCSKTEGEMIIENGLNQVGTLFAGIAAGAAVLFGVIGGMQLLLSFGDESKITKGRNSMILSLAGFSLVLGAQVIVASTVTKAQGIIESKNPFVEVMEIAVNVMVSTLNAIFVLVMILTGIRMVIAHGNAEDFGKGRKAFIFAFVGAFFVNLAKAFVQGILNSGFQG